MLISDLRWALRLLLKNPGFTIAALLSLSIGFGVTTLVFTYASGAFLRPIPVRDPGTFVIVSAQMPALDLYPELRSRTSAQLDLIAYAKGFANFASENESGSVRTLTVSDNYFEALRLQPEAGRLLASDDDQENPDGCVISHYLWTSRFGAAPGAVGQVIRLRQRNVTIVGIGPTEFRGTDVVPFDVWLPAPSPSLHVSSEKAQWQLAGRLRSGVSIAQARVALERGMRELRLDEGAGGGNRRVGMQSLGEIERIRYAPVAFFTGLGCLVLLVGCANVAGLLSTRSIERRTEIAIRLALGSGRARLVRLLLTESFLLSLASSALAFLLTWGLVQAVKPWLPRDLIGAALDGISVDTRVLVATLALAAVATVVAGLLPAWRASRTDLVSALKGDASTGEVLHARVSMRKTLVVLQLAISFAFICIGGLFIRSMSIDRPADLEFDRLAVVGPLVGGESGPRRRATADLVMDAVKEVPGVKDATLASSGPLAMYRSTTVVVDEDKSRAVVGRAILNSALSNYFDITGTRIIRGRPFSDYSGIQAGGEVVISEAMAGRFWPGRDPLGRFVRLGDAKAQPCIVVGIAKEVAGAAAGLYDRPAEPVIYVPASSSTSDTEATVLILVRTHGPASAVLSDIRSRLLKLPSSIGNLDSQTLENHMRYLFRPQQFGALFAVILGVLASTLAAFGLYSVTSSVIAARTREIGIRMALGATASQIARLFLKQAVKTSLCGIFLGVPLAWGAALILRSGMFGIVPINSWTLVVSAIAVVSATLVASYLPARRAARVAPMTALRTE